MKVFFTDIAWSSGNLWKLVPVSADVKANKIKQQEIKDRMVVAI